MELNPLPAAALYQVRDTTCMVCLIKVRDNEWALSVINCADDKTNVVFVGLAHDVSMFEDPRWLNVDGSNHKLFLGSANLDTGSWKELGAHPIMERVPLEEYEITLDANGVPTQLARKSA